MVLEKAIMYIDQGSIGKTPVPQRLRNKEKWNIKYLTIGIYIYIHNLVTIWYIFYSLIYSLKIYDIISIISKNIKTLKLFKNNIANWIYINRNEISFALTKPWKYKNCSYLVSIGKYALTTLKNRDTHWFK